jgi:hypothetical protein
MDRLFCCVFLALAAAAGPAKADPFDSFRPLAGAADLEARFRAVVEVADEVRRRIAAAETVDEAEAFIRADVARNAELLRLANFQPE